MQVEIIDRVIKEAEHIAETGATVRATASDFAVSKSTVHKDVTERLKKIDGALYKRVKKILGKNLSERHIRGGEATKKKYQTLNKKRKNVKIKGSVPNPD